MPFLFSGYRTKFAGSHMMSCLWNCQTVFRSGSHLTFLPTGKLSSGHRTGKGQFSFQFQRKAMPKNAHTIALISQARRVMLKILQAGLQQYVNHELPDVKAGFRKGGGTRDQIANIRWITEKAREFQKNIYFCFTDCAKAFDCGSPYTMENSSRDGNTRPPDLPLEKSICRSGSNS